MLHKLHMVADYEGRSTNSQILILIRDCIQSYEQTHGEIQFHKDKTKKDVGKKLLMSFLFFKSLHPLPEISQSKTPGAGTPGVS